MSEERQSATVRVLGLSARTAATSAAVLVVSLAAGSAVGVIRWEPAVVVGGLGVIGVVYWFARFHAALRRRFEDLEAVYEFTRSIDRAADIDEVTDTTLRQCRALFGASLVEVVMERGVGSTATRLTAGDDMPQRRPAPPQMVAILMQGDKDTPVVAVPLADAASPVRSYYASLGIERGMLARLAGGRGSAVMIVVGLENGSEEADPDALRLFDTLTRQARVAFERVHLMDRLLVEMNQKEHQAFHDSLTGLPNRLQFSIVVEEALRRAGEADAIVAVLLIDLDHFKEVNDTLGHQRGDVLLRDTAMRLSAAAAEGEHLARLGGDEFGVVLRRAKTVADAVGAARRFGEAVYQPFMSEGLTVHIGASIGIAVAPDHGSDGTTLLRRAEVAMYGAKEASTSVEVYDPSRDRYSTRRLALAAELKMAVESGSLGVHYQPKVAMGDGYVVGIEALARWHHVRHGDVTPDEFIELAERTGLIHPLTEHVLRTAFRDSVRLRSEGQEISVAVNVAPSLLVDLEFPDLLAQLVGESAVDPRTVVLEVTESTMMTDSAKARSVLEALDEIGVELSIDDFGTGYSSLAYLSTLPVDELKIDRSFVMGMAVDERLASIVTSTIALGHALGLRVVAEGVENRGTWDLLREAGCDLAQGYHVSRPMPFTDLLAWVESGGIADGERGPRAVSE
jgi:diguanylate cyclase (GGDEF)-like protein